jgi:hypothetical protein
MSDYQNDGCGQYFFVIIVVPFILISILVFTFGDDIIVPWLILTFIWYLFYHIQTDRVKKKREEERDKERKRQEIKEAKQDIKMGTKTLKLLESRKDKNLYLIKEFKSIIQRAENKLKYYKENSLNLFK